MLKLDQITVQYGALVALNAVDLCIDEGTINVIEGHHGAGTVSYTHLTLPTNREV